MSTHDVPGANPRNGDALAMGCWAEHEDESLIFVESTEGGRVIYSIFDVAKEPPVEYRDAMPEAAFKLAFSWRHDSDQELWTWHDKTPFPWDRVIKAGAADGARFASADDELNAAERIAESLRLRGRAIDRDDMSHRKEQTIARIGGILDSLKDAISELAK